jgi:Domain of Unknown Function (DUF928)
MKIIKLFLLIKGLPKNKLYFLVGWASLPALVLWTGWNAINTAFLSCTTVRAQPPIVNPSKQTNKPIIFAAPPPPADIGEPGRRGEAGSRRPCGDNSQEVKTPQKPLTAIVPISTSGKSRVVWGLTTSERPTFWFYVPYSTSATFAEFVLEDATENQTKYKIPLKNTPGVVNFKLPDTSTPLAVDKQYRWYFNIYCKENNGILGYVEGNVQRKLLSPALKTQLEKATQRQKVAIYASNGIWHEAITTLAQQLVQQRSTLKADWASLLQSIGLENLASEAITQ